MCRLFKMKNLICCSVSTAVAKQASLVLERTWRRHTGQNKHLYTNVYTLQLTKKYLSKKDCIR